MSLRATSNLLLVHELEKTEAFAKKEGGGRDAAEAKVMEQHSWDRQDVRYAMAFQERLRNLVVSADGIPAEDATCFECQETGQLCLQCNVNYCCDIHFFFLPGRNAVCPPCHRRLVRGTEKEKQKKPLKLSA